MANEPGQTTQLTHTTTLACICMCTLVREVFEEWVHLWNRLELSVIKFNRLFDVSATIVKKDECQGRGVLTLTTPEMSTNCHIDQVACGRRTIYRPLTKSLGPFGRLGQAMAMALAGVQTVRCACACVDESHQRLTLSQMRLHHGRRDLVVHPQSHCQGRVLHTRHIVGPGVRGAHMQSGAAQ